MTDPVAKEGQAAAEYLAGLNQCFPGWGDDTNFDWCFRRSAGAGSADLIGIREDGRLIAGSAVTYRRARIDGQRATIGCMTASWTLPEARGKGCFARLIQGSMDRARARGCDILSAFTRAENSSSRALSRAGSTQLPSWYLRIATSAEPTIGTTRVDPTSLEPRLNGKSATRGDGIIYPAASDWIGQAVARPRDVGGLFAEPDIALIYERSGDAVQLLASSADRPASQEIAIRALANHCAGAAIHWWTMDEGEAAYFERRGARADPGWVHILPLGDRGAPRGGRLFANVDRM